MLDVVALPAPIWIVAPHPDDEALGSGALLAQLTDLGREVWAMLMTDGGQSHPNSARFPRPRLAQTRLAEWRAGLSELGLAPEHTRALGLADGELGRAAPREVQAQVRAAWALAPPATLLLPWRRDPHQDHRACWAHFQPLLSGVPCVLEYAVWLAERGLDTDWPQPTEQMQAFSVPISASQQERKARAIAAHRTQLGLITDDPGGFVLSSEMVARAVAGPELYFGRPVDFGA